MEVKKLSVQIAALICVFIPMVYGCSERAVTDKLFQNYSKLTRPVLRQNTTVDIQLELKIYNIISINEPDEIMNLVLWTTTLWNDQFLTWNPDDFDGCTEIKVPADQIWTPDIYFINSLQIDSIAPSDITFAAITNDGSVRLALKFNVQLDCTMAISDFPFDTQNCPITVGLWTYNYSEIVLHLRYPINGLQPMNNDPSFAPIIGNDSAFETVTYTGLEVQTTVGNQAYSELHYSVGLKRRTAYYIYVILVPSYLLTSLCIIGIFTPNSNINERNERTTLGLTTLLSLAFILDIVADEMPKGQGLPLLGIYMLLEIGVCALAIVMSTFVIMGHQRSLTRGWKPPAICYWIAGAQASKNIRGISPIDEKYKSAYGHDISVSDNNNQAAAIHSERQYDVLQSSCNLLRKAIESMESGIREKEEREHRESVWIKCFDMIDSFLLVFMLLLNTILSLVLLV